MNVSTSRGLICTVAVLASTGVTSNARAAFHLWNIQEIYTNNTGSLQFIELHDPSGFQDFVGGMQIRVSNPGNTQTNTFTVPSNAPPGGTFNRTLLFGTSGIQAAGAPAPNYIIPDNFLFAEGGSISFFGANSGPYTALPTDGTLSRDWASMTNSVNSPKNFAGQTGTIIVPEPAALGLAACGLAMLSRRRAAR